MELVKTEQEAKPFPLEKQAIQYNIEDTVIDALADKATGLTIDGVDDKEGLKLVRSTRIDAKNLRTGVENRRKELKNDVVEYGNKIDGEAKRIKEKLSAIEAPLQKLEDDIETEKERIKQEEIEATERAYQDRVTKILDTGAISDSISFVTGHHSIYCQELRSCTDEEFEATVELFVAEKTKLDAEKAEQDRLEQERLDQEEKDRQEAEDKQLAEEKANKEKLADQEKENARIKAESDAKDAELAEMKRKMDEMEKAAAPIPEPEPEKVEEQGVKLYPADPNAEVIQTEEKQGAQELMRDFGLDADKKACFELRLPLENHTIVTSCCDIDLDGNSFPLQDGERLVGVDDVNDLDKPRRWAIVDFSELGWK